MTDKKRAYIVYDARARAVDTDAATVVVIEDTLGDAIVSAKALAQPGVVYSYALEHSPAGTCYSDERPEWAPRLTAPIPSSAGQPELIMHRGRWLLALSGYAETSFVAVSEEFAAAWRAEFASGQRGWGRIQRSLDTDRESPWCEYEDLDACRRAAEYEAFLSEVDEGIEFIDEPDLGPLTEEEKARLLADYADD